MRGLLKQLNTRIYFPDEPANADDAGAANRAGDAARDADRQARRRQPGALEWNVILQGDGETVFFDLLNARIGRKPSQTRRLP